MINIVTPNLPWYFTNCIIHQVLNEKFNPCHVLINIMFMNIMLIKNSLMWQLTNTSIQLLYWAQCQVCNVQHFSWPFITTVIFPRAWYHKSLWPLSNESRDFLRGGGVVIKSNHISIKLCSTENPIIKII